ncbi:MAG: hypothetical protein FWB84_03250 [Candidatus Bathyarchaeota archaeon]|uniref:hypothetical protein n=1 Tax=Candidatus Bathycorpusculum sp. TaxID=2994959 RepID=UPI00281A99C1|nr:hypothetical protein [Candidatus Termiticorpusculum sp.]MCL2257584.1 hypothetical protein [Candidatus Termiticorpusculum sp.]MCL2292272.1 hypothetical protein [Candidatus Termiticorpusculum sp.]
MAIALLTTISASKTSKKTNKAKQYSNYKTTYPYQQQQYYTSQFNAQMELDLRLPYRRFKQLYPNNNITYDEYKKMQNQQSFKHAISSQKNRRMIR